MWRKSGQHGSNLGPKMEAKSMNDEVEKQSIFQCFLESILYAIFVDFWWKMEASWHQDGSQIDVNYEKRCYEKT